MCRLSCTASLILSINELRSTLLPRTPSINHNLSSVLCSPHSPTLPFSPPSSSSPPNHTIPPLPVPYLPAADSISSLYLLLTYFSTDSPHNSRLSVFLCCSSLCTCSLSCRFYLHLHLQLLRSFFPPSCTCVLLSFLGMVEHTEWVFPLKIHILIPPALQG